MNTMLPQTPEGVKALNEHSSEAAVLLLGASALAIVAYALYKVGDMATAFEMSETFIGDTEAL